MTVSDAIKSIRSAKEVLVFVLLDDDDGDYFSVSKAEAIRTLKWYVEQGRGSKSNLSKVRVENGTVYVN